MQCLSHLHIHSCPSPLRFTMWLPQPVQWPVITASLWGWLLLFLGLALLVLAGVLLLRWWTRLAVKTALLQSRLEQLEAKMVDRQPAGPVLPSMPEKAEAQVDDPALLLQQTVAHLGRKFEELRDKEAPYHNLLDNVPAGVVVHGPDTRVLLSNAVAGESQHIVNR